MLKNVLFATALCLGSACASAAPTVLTFDDAVPDEIGVIRDYAGFSWRGFYFQDGAVHVGTGNPNGGLSDHNHPWPGGFAPLGSFEGNASFPLERLYLASVENNDNTVRFTGYRNVQPDTPVFVRYVTVNTGALTPVDLNWRDVDSVAISSQRGFVVIDNITVSPVPEPSSVAMLASAAGLFGLLARRRKNAGVTPSR